jgi:MoxR-like ATPase
MVERVLIGLLTGGTCCSRACPASPRRSPSTRSATTIAGPVLAHPVHARPAAGRPHRHGDLPPADGSSHAKKGPIFANLVLADEINRAPAKVQSALLEAMQERRSPSATRPTAARALHRHGDAEPHRAGGHLPLPEAQVDRFMLMVKVGYPTREEERAIMDRMPDARSTRPRPTSPAKVDPEQLLKARGRSARSTSTTSSRTTSSIVFATREPAKAGPQGPRAHDRARRLARAPASRSTWPRARTRSCAPRLRHPRGHQGHRAPTCCATASSSPTRPRPRRSRATGGAPDLRGRRGPLTRVVP